MIWLKLNPQSHQTQIVMGFSGLDYVLSSLFTYKFILTFAQKCILQICKYFRHYIEESKSNVRGDLIGSNEILLAKSRKIMLNTSKIKIY